MILNIVLLIFLLGIIIFIHELGHFIFAKKFKVYVHEFALGMGPKIFSKKRKNDETIYSIRLFPIGGFVKLAGEDETSEFDEKIKDDRKLNNKKPGEKFLILAAGAVFNFILAFTLLFFGGLIFGVIEEQTYLGELREDFPSYIAGLRKGDLLLEVNDQKVNTWDKVNLEFAMLEDGQELKVKVLKENNEEFEVVLSPIMEEERYIYGITSSDEISYGLISSFKYAVLKFLSLFEMMFLVIVNLIKGTLGMDSVSGPVGLYSIMDSAHDIQNFIFLLSLISLNVGFINLIPFPAFDGGRLLFIVISKVKGKEVSYKTESLIHNIGFFILMALMVYITITDILKLF